MKTVFVLGAGASATTGAPLMANFLKTAKGLLAQNSYGNDAHHIQDVIDAAQKDLKAVFAKSNISNITNIEELFSAIDIGQLIRSYGGRTPESIDSLRRSIVIFIYRTIEETVNIGVDQSHIEMAGDYNMLTKLVRSKLEKTAGLGRNDVSFITFNYDACLEFCLGRRGIGVDYALGERFVDTTQEASRTNVSVLKLHGSINWARCQICNKIVPTEIDPLRNVSRMQLLDTSVLRLNLGSRIAKHQHSCGSQFDPDPVIVPPTWNKSSSIKGLELVWQKAAAELASAENIIVIGYSFPKTDAFFKYLFALGSHSDTHLENMLVLSGGDSGSNGSSFSDLLGPMSSGAFKHYAFDFGGSGHLIEEILNL